MNATNETTEYLDRQDACIAVVIYDGDATRDRAMAACDHLVKQFWAEVEFEFHWWRTDFLADPELAGTAAANALEADCLILSTAPDQDLPAGLKAWLESRIARREYRDGALLDLTGSLAATPGVRQRELFLRQFARRAGFDYLTASPQNVASRLPHSFDTARLRAGTPAAVDDMFTHSPPPNHFGLND